MVDKNTDEIAIFTITPSFIAGIKKLQKAMKGAAEEAGWKSEDDVVAYIKEIRAEISAEKSHNMKGESQF